MDALCSVPAYPRATRADQWGCPTHSVCRGRRPAATPAPKRSEGERRPKAAAERRPTAPSLREKRKFSRTVSRRTHAEELAPPATRSDSTRAALLERAAETEAPSSARAGSCRLRR